MTTKEAATVLGVTARRVVAMVKAGRLRATKHGNVLWITRAALEAVMDRKNGRPLKGEQK